MNGIGQMSFAAVVAVLRQIYSESIVQTKTLMKNWALNEERFSQLPFTQYTKIKDFYQNAIEYNEDVQLIIKGYEKLKGYYTDVKDLTKAYEQIKEAKKHHERAFEILQSALGGGKIDFVQRVHLLEQAEQEFANGKLKLKEADAILYRKKDTEIVKQTQQGIDKALSNK